MSGRAVAAGEAVSGGLAVQDGVFEATLADASKRVGLQSVETARTGSLSDEHLLPGRGAGLALNGVPSPAHVAGDLPNPGTLNEQVVNELVVFAAVLRHRPPLGAASCVSAGGLPAGVVTGSCRQLLRERVIALRGVTGSPTVGRVVDQIFGRRRLAEIYDPLDPDRSDLDAYGAMVGEFGARSVLDIGCGTGTFACLLANRGLAVTAVDPAAASLDVARTKPGADRVRWVHGYASDLPPLQVDLATMTANVAQVFLTDEDWAATLHATHAALRPGAHLAFETRDPAAKAWLDWNRDQSHRYTVIPRVGDVDTWVDVIDISDDLVSFRWTFVFGSDGARLTSDSTLRFRHRDEVTASLAAAGYAVVEERQAPDRPGREMVFIARRPE